MELPATVGVCRVSCGNGLILCSMITSRDEISRSLEIGGTEQNRTDATAFLCVQRLDTTVLYMKISRAIYIYDAMKISWSFRTLCEAIDTLPQTLLSSNSIHPICDEQAQFSRR